MTYIEASPLDGKLLIDHMRARVSRSSTNRIHNHPYAELVIVERGDTVYTSGGSIRRLGDKTVIYNPPHLIHNPFVQQERLYERLKIKFYPNDIISETIDPNLLKLFTLQTAKELDDVTFDEINAVARGLFRDSSEDGSLAISLCERSALIYVLSRIARADERSSWRKRGYIDDVTEYITKNIGEKMTAEDLAARHFVSKSKLNYDFRAYSNMTLNEYITLARIEKAKELLLTGRSVFSIAEECGFSSSSYFIKVFGEVVGSTPLKYQIDKGGRTKNEI